MKKTLSYVYKALSEGAIIFSLIILFFAIFGFNTATAYFTKDVILSIFSFSFIFGLSNLLYRIKGIPYAILVVIHFVVNVVNYIFNIIAIVERSESQMFVGVFIFVLLYIVIFIFIKFIKFLCTERKKEEISENNAFSE